MEISKGLNKVRRGIASFSLVALLAGFLAINVAQAATFSDVQPSDWFYTYVEQLATDGVLNTASGTYRPGDLVNRAEMAKLAVEAFELTLENPATPTFKDVPQDAWFYQYVETAAKNGIVGGYKNENGTLTGYYGPGDSLTREQAMKILVLAAPLATNTNGGPHFADVPTSTWSYEYVETGYNMSVVDGYPDGSFGPGKNINRAEIAKMVSNAMNPVARPGMGFEVSDVTALNSTSLEVCFNGPADQATAEDQANYSIKDANNVVLAVSGATLATDMMCVDLTTAGQVASTMYTLTVTGVTSESGEDLTAGEVSFNGYSTVAVGGDLNVEANDSTPAGVTLPASVSGVPIFSFNLVGGADDVTVTSIELHRGGTGVDASVTNVALFDETNRVSKAKTFNTSTDTATVSLLSGGLVVKAGETKKLTVVATIGTAAAAQGSEFYLELVKASVISSNAKSVTGSFPVEGKTFKVGSTDGGVITWLDNGKPSDPKLGALQADVSKFKLRNESNDNDMSVNSLTLKETSGGVNVDTETENWSLYADGTKVAEVAKSVSKYITFNFTSALVLQPSKTVSFVVKTDIIGGAGKTLQFALDNTLDLSATDAQFGYGARVCYETVGTCFGTGTGTVGTDYDEEIVTVQAGEVSILSTDAASTDILKNKKNIVAGSFKITTKAGLNLELQKVRVSLANSDVAASAEVVGAACSVGVGVYDSALMCLVQNVELYDLKTGSVYDLPALSWVNNKSGVFGDTNVTIALTAGETREFQIRFDTLNRVITGAKLDFSLPNIGNTAGALYMVETNDNTAVTDVTPSSITYKTLNGVAATATINTITMSTNKNVVVGGKGVEVLSFDIAAGNASKLNLSEVKVGVTRQVAGAGPWIAATNSTINTMYLYKVGTTNTLLAQKSGSLLAAGILTFDGFDIEVPLNGTVRFLVTTDIVDDQTKATDLLKFWGESLKLVDFDNDDVTVGTVNGTAATLLTNLPDQTGAILPAGGNLVGYRQLTLSGVGTLTLAVRTDDSASSIDKNLVGGTTSDFVATYEFTAQNEPILVRDLTFVASAVTFANDVSEIIVYKNDKVTELARKAVTTNTTVFTDINYTVEMGSERMYIKVKTQKIGKDEAGAVLATDYTLTANVTKADGASSSKALAATGATAVSKLFRSHEVNVTGVSFVNTATVNGATETVDAALKAGVNTNAIIAIATAPSTNTNTVTGGSVQTALTTFNFDVAGTATGSNAIQVIRLGGSGDNNAVTVGVNGPGAMVTTMGTMDAVNWAIANGQVAYYVIKSTSALAVSGYTQVKFTALPTQVLFNTDQAPLVLPSIGVRLASATLDGPSLEYKP